MVNAASDASDGRSEPLHGRPGGAARVGTGQWLGIEISARRDGECEREQETESVAAERSPVSFS